MGDEAASHSYNTGYPGFQSQTSYLSFQEVITGPEWGWYRRNFHNHEHHNSRQHFGAVACDTL